MSPDPEVPVAFDVVTVVVLRRSVDAPDLPDDELDALQARHLAYRRELVTRGLIAANGPFDEQSDPSYRGMSIFTCDPAEAAQGLVGWLEHEADVIIAHVHPDHRASAAGAAACGLVPTGEVVDGEIRWRRTRPG